MLPGSLGHLGVRASEVGFGELEIEHRLTLGLVFGIDDLAGFLLGGLPRDWCVFPFWNRHNRRFRGRVRGE